MRQITNDFPFLPAGCNLQLDPVAQRIVLDSVRNAIPSTWRDKCGELRSLGDVSLAEYLEQTGLDLEDIYAGNHSWTEMRRAAQLPTVVPGPEEAKLLRAIGRLCHVDDDERIAVYRSLVAADERPDLGELDERALRWLRMLVGSLTTLSPSATLTQAVDQLWEHPQVRSELVELLNVLPSRVDHVHPPLDLDGVPLRVHARYTRLEVLAAFGVGDGARPPTWQTGVWYAKESKADLFAFTLDKSSGGFSPTTRYRDYAVSRDLIHWESQSVTWVESETGQRYINHEAVGSKIVLFARLRTDKRAFSCLGAARHVSHSGDRPIAFVWQLDHPLPPDLYTSFAAAVG